MKTAIFGHDDGCGEPGGGEGPMAPPLTFAAPASTLSVTGSSHPHQRRSGPSQAAAVAAAVAAANSSGSATSNVFRLHTRRTSRMQNVCSERSVNLLCVKTPFLATDVYYLSLHFDL